MLLYLVAIVHCVSLIQGYQFNEYMNDEEIKRIFEPEHDSVPEYDIVTINFNRIQKRSTDDKHSHTLSFEAFNKTLTFDFEQNENLLMGKYTSLYVAHKYDRFFVQEYDTNILAYHDVNKRAAVVTALNENGQVEVHGTIGNDMYIRPLSSYLSNMKSNTISRLRKLSKRSIYEFNKIFDSNQHIIVKMKNEFNNTAFEVQEIPPIAPTNNKSRNINKRDVVDIVYPELLITVDIDLFKAKNLDKNNLMKYIFAVYNSVDLRFRILENPKIRLSIRTVLVEGEPGSISFYKEDTIDKDYLDIHKTLYAMGKFFWKNYVFSSLNQDVSIGMIGHPNVGIRDKNQNFRIGTLGLAFVGAACNHDSGDMDSSVLVARDRGDFGSVNVITHELGHLFGSAHDENANEKENCIDPHHIMYPEANSISEDWSVCSQKQIHDYLTTSWASCLRQKPTVKEPFPVLFPGQIVKTLDEQCQQSNPGATAVIDDDEDFPCNTLRCQLEEDTETMIWNIPNGALDGTPCNDNQGICMFDKCVPVDSTFPL